MRTRVLCVLPLLLFLIAGPALAGADKWTGKFGAEVKALAKGERAAITPSGTGVTKILEISACKGGVLATDDNTVTFDIQWCNTSAGACYVANDTSPIDSATDSGMQMDPLPPFIRINVVANAGATFVMSCK